MQIDRENISRMIGQRIHEYRVMRKLSQEALALSSDIHPAYLGRIERGEKCPTLDTLYKISQGLKIPLPELLNVEADIQPTNTEAVHRIQNVLQCLSAEEATEIAAIVEQIVAFKHPEAL